jgi:hypothetical protein
MNNDDVHVPIWYPLFGLPVCALAVYIACHNWGWWRCKGSYRCSSDGVDWMMAVSCVFFFCVGTGVALAIAGGVAAAFCAVIRDMAEQEYRVCWKARMVSMRSFDGVAGSMSGGIFMMCGRMGSENYYTYYTAAKDGSFRPHKWRADSSTRIFEEDRKDGEVIQWDQHFKSAWVNWFASPSDSIKMDFRIPNGSLKQNFSVE